MKKFTLGLYLVYTMIANILIQVCFCLSKDSN